MPFVFWPIFQVSLKIVRRIVYLDTHFWPISCHNQSALLLFMAWNVNFYFNGSLCKLLASQCVLCTVFVKFKEILLWNWKSRWARAIDSWLERAFGLEKGSPGLLGFVERQEQAGHKSATEPYQVLKTVSKVQLTHCSLVSVIGVDTAAARSKRKTICKQ